jgi:predicted deacylase
MPRIMCSPDKLDFNTPGRRDYWVTLEHGTMWGNYWIPLTVMVGPQAKPGEGVVAIGSTHGNEYEGPVAIKNLLSKINLADVTGRIVLIPVLNPEAFRTGTRDSVGADGVNLNRAFVDGAGKSPALAGVTHRIAKFIREAIWPQVHVVLDLHSGGHLIRFSHCASYHPVEDPELDRKIDRAARRFGVPLIMNYQNETPGLLTSEAERLGKITVGTELGWGAAVDLRGVRWGTQGVLAAAIDNGQLKGSLPDIDHHADGSQVKAAIVDRECYTSAPFPGHFEELIPCGTRVKEGETIGYLHDFARLDDAPWPCKAGVEGVIVGTAWGAVVQQGQHIVCVGRIL